MSSVSTTPKSSKNQPQKILVPNLGYDKNVKYLIEFDGQKKDDQQNLIHFLSNNNIKFDKNIPQRVYEAKIQLKNVNSKDLLTISKDSIIPTIPPEISPEKLEQHKLEKLRKKRPQPKITYNMFGEKIQEENVIQRLTKSPTTSERWKLKGFDQLQKNFDKQKEKKKIEKMLHNLPSSPDSALNSNRESQAIHSSQHKRTVSFKMYEDKNNYVTFNANNQNDGYETFEQLQQSINLNKQKRESSSMNIQDPLDTSILNRSYNKQEQQQQQILKSSLKLQKVISNADQYQPQNSQKKIAFQNIMKVNGQEGTFRKVEDSFCDENNNIFNQKLMESFLIMPQDKQAANTSMTLIQTDPHYHTFSPSINPKKNLENILSDEELDNSSNIKSSNIPKKIVKGTQVDPTQSYILKIQKEKQEKQKTINKSITNVNLKNIKSKIYGYINPSKSPKRIVKSSKQSTNIQELKDSFLENLRSSQGGGVGKPIPKSLDKNKNKLNQSLNMSQQSPLLRGSIYSKETGSDSKYNSVERSLKLSKILDPASQKQFEVLQKHNQNFKIKSGFHYHKYCLAGQEDKFEKNNKDTKNLSKSQILQKYAEKEKTELSKPSIYEWELNDDEMSELDNNEELTPKNFNKFAEKYQKWWYNLDDSQKMHFFSSEELVKYYKDVKSTTKKSLLNFLKLRKNKRQH